MEPEFSFPNSLPIHLAPPLAGHQKSRAKSMSDDPPVRRQHFHAHRRSAAVSEDLGKLPLAFSPLLKASTPDVGVPEDRKVAFVEPEISTTLASSVSANSLASNRSPHKSPRRRTMSTVAPQEETPCIDLDEALYSNTLMSHHRRSESLPNGLKSPFLPPPATPRLIEPLQEEDERESCEQQRPQQPQQQTNQRHQQKHTQQEEPHRASSDSNRSNDSGSNGSGHSIPKKRFSFFRPSSPFSPRKLRDPPSVSSLGIPDTNSSSTPPSSIHSGTFTLGEPGPVNPPSPEKRTKKSPLFSWVYRRRELKYL